MDPIKVDEALRSLEYASKVQESLHLQVKRISGEMMFERKEVIDFTEKNTTLDERLYFAQSRTP